MSRLRTVLAESPRSCKLALAILMLLSLWPAAHAGYMLGKAELAQWLIASAWQQNRDARPWPWADTRPVARLQIDRLQHNSWVLAGASGATLAFGPGLAQGSAAPGTPGVTLIGGHRDSHFRVLEDVRIGDVIRLQGQDRRWQQYRVSNLAVADSRRDAIALNSTHNRLVLITCYPFDALMAGGPLRYLVEAELEPTAG